MGNVLVKEETLTQIADAIREKSGSNDSYRPGEMPDAILEISTYSGEGADPNKPIRFYDPYGNLVYSYTINEFAALTELPELPEIRGLTGQNWNWSLEKILEVNGELEIGSMYITDDGATRIYIDLIEEALNPKIGFKQDIANSVWIDWGDGSDLESSDVYGGESVSIEHQYAKEGSYVIRLIPDEGAAFELFGYALGSVILHKVMESSYANLVYANAIQKIELGKGMTSLGDYAFTGGTIKSVTIPEGISNFKRAFAKCKGIEYLAFPKSLSSLTTSAMDSCVALRKIVFGETYIYLSQYVFYNCAQLEEILLPPNISIGAGYVFSGCQGVKRIIVANAGIIGESDFYNCQNAKEIVVKGNIYDIGGSAFRSCSNAQYIDIPSSVLRIGSYAFGQCNALRKFVIPDGVTEIKSSLCSQNNSLQEIIIPEGVTTIANYAFNSCNGLEDYFLYPTTPPTLASVNALTVTEGVKIHVPKGCLEAYQTAENWSTYADYMVEMEE